MSSGLLEVVLFRSLTATVTGWEPWSGSGCGDGGFRQFEPVGSYGQRGAEIQGEGVDNSFKLLFSIRFHLFLSAMFFCFYPGIVHEGRLFCL